MIKTTELKFHYDGDSTDYWFLVTAQVTFNLFVIVLEVRAELAVFPIIPDYSW